MKTKAPRRRTKFAGIWDEIGYLRDQLRFWLHERGDAEKARRYAKRLRRLLSKADSDQEAILGQECRSLLCEAEGDLIAAIEHRENEVRMIRKLQEISAGKPFEQIALNGYGVAEMQEKLKRLAVLYLAVDDIQQTVATLQEAKQYQGREKDT